MQTSALPTGWQRVKVDDVKSPEKGSIVSGPFGSNIGKRFFVENGIPVIRGNNLTLGTKRFVDEGFVFITEEKAFELRNCAALPGDIVFTAAGTLGQVGLIPNNARYPRYVVSNKQLRLRCDSKIASPEYLYYWFSEPRVRHYIINQNTGASVPLITLGTLRNLPLDLPPLPTQRKIAAVLSAYDDLIENNTRRIKILEEMAQMVYREWFVNFRFPGHEKVKMVESELGLIPEGWEVHFLSDFVDTQYGFTESAKSEPIGPKFLRGMDINKCSYIDWSTVPYCPISLADHRKYRLKTHDIVIIRMADPGKVGIVEKDVDAVFASYLIRLSINSQVVSPYYVFYFLLSDRYQGYITGASTGTTRKSAAAGVITNVKVAVPPCQIMHEFERNISDIRTLMVKLVDANTNLRATRDLLLPRLISGELDVENLDIKTGVAA